MFLPSYIRNLVLIVFEMGFLFVFSPVQSKELNNSSLNSQLKINTTENTNLNINEAQVEAVERLIARLDALSKKFSSGLHCEKDDYFCWWFLFHLNIGREGNGGMQSFAHSVPIITKYKDGQIIEKEGKKYKEIDYEIFAGEAHIFQMPAYWILKGVPLSLRLSNGRTLREYIRQTDWEKVLSDVLIKKNTNYINPELSWYNLGRQRVEWLPELSALSEEEFPKDQISCGSSHELASERPVSEERLVNYSAKIKNMLENVQPTDVDLESLFLATHVLEAYSLIGRRDLIDQELLDFELRFGDDMIDKFERNLKELKREMPLDGIDEFDENFNANAFLEKFPDASYGFADLFGHFLFGLRLYLGKESLE